MMQQVRTLRVMARDPDLVSRGYLPYTRAEIVLRWLYPSTWSLDLPATPAVLRRVGPGWGVRVFLDEDQVLSGDMEEIERERAEADTLSVTGADDLAVVAAELAYPDPSAAATAQTAESHDSRSGPAETVIKGYVAANIGVGRAAARADAAVPDAREVTVAPDLGRGGTVSARARFDPLMDLVRQVHGGLGVTCHQQDGGLVFDTVEPRDLSTSATFSFETGNLASCRWATGYPDATHVVVAGEGEGVDRIFRQRSDPAAAQEWRRVTRKFVDQRHTSDTAELDQAGDEELERGSRTGIIAATLRDTPRLRFGEHYRLGDRVTISPAAGVVFTDIITSVTIIADTASGELTITPAIGWADGPYETRQDQQTRDLTRRVGALERSQ